MGGPLSPRSRTPRPLPADFYDRPVLDVARDLLGAVVTRRTPEGTVVVRLTEVEAYAGADDPASHAYRGPTPRNATMFGPPGRLYVYFTYGMHFCMNVVCARPGTAQAVLLRAGEVTDGLDLARARRPGARDRDLARGPARLTKTLAVTRDLDDTDLTNASAPLVVCAGETVPDGRVGVGPRVGVAAAANHPWRIYVTDDPTVSVYRPAVPRRRRGVQPA